MPLHKKKMEPLSIKKKKMKLKKDHKIFRNTTEVQH